MHKWYILTMMLLGSYSFSSAQDWANLGKYKEANEQLGDPARGEKRIVFMGNSITEAWQNADPGFFRKYRIVNRGISGQTTFQMLLRFRQDVIDLKPMAVFILGGINDIATNSDSSGIKVIIENLESMATLAKASGIQVVLGSVFLADGITWPDNPNPSVQVTELNQWLKDYAGKNDLTYIDYFTPILVENGGSSQNLAGDGVHPTKAGYSVMKDLAVEQINRLRKK